MEESETKRRIEQDTDKACVSIERIESTLLSSLAKKGNEKSNKRNYRCNKHKSEEEVCSTSRIKKCSRGWVRYEEDEEENGKKTRKRKSKRQQNGNKVELDEALRLQRRSRYLLIKMRMQQNLIDAYATEGWKGQSREKIRPDKELERARKQILNCKLGLRDAIRQLDLLSSVGSIEEKVMAPDGAIHHDHIFCAECNSREAFPDNDIILCDGTCNRAFHQKCLDPPLETENIPPGDQGWFCKFCDCKMEIIDTMNAQIGTHFPVDSNWQDIFNEEASLPNGSEATLNKEADWPSDDSEDGDYDPEMMENGGGSSSRNDSGDGGGGDSDGESISTSLSLASDGVALSTGSWEGHGFNNMVESGETSNEETICGPRQRQTVDYKKLYSEMFGNDAALQEQGSEDEDWGPSKRRKRKKESDATSTIVTTRENSKKDQDVEEIPEQSEKESVSVEGKGGRRPIFRIPRDAVEKLRQVFAENELPSKAVRDSLSKELSLDPDKVSKWFKNTRYMALKNRKMESVKQPEDSKPLFGPEAVMERNTETNEIHDTVDEAVKEKNTETDEIRDAVDETIMEKYTEPKETQDTVEETVAEKNTEETNEIQDSVDETVTENKTEETNEIQDTVLLGFDDSAVNRTTISPRNDNQEVIQQADNTFPATIEDKSQQYLVQKDSSFTLVTHEELSNEISLKTPLEENVMSAEDKETEIKMTEEEDFEAIMEMICRAENKLMDVTQRLERFKTPRGRKKLGKSSSSSSSVPEEEDSVVYVPIAEVKEKK